MPLTRDFRETVKARAQHDPAFRAALLEEALDCMLQGDIKTGKLVLRNYINATRGFATLAKAMHQSPKSLMRMLSPGGNPAAGSVFRIFQLAQGWENIRLSVLQRAQHFARHQRMKPAHERHGTTARKNAV